MYIIKDKNDNVIAKDHPEYEELHIEDELRYLSIGETITGKYEYKVTSKGVVIVHSAFSGYTPRWGVMLRRRN